MITSPTSATQEAGSTFEKRVEASHVGDQDSSKSIRTGSTASSHCSAWLPAPSFWRFRNEDGSHPDG
jgi:hypothetical protein